MFAQGSRIRSDVEHTEASLGALDGKVALITGAGGGIGREHALAFAAEGARVVVNDLGGARDGTGASGSMADRVAAEIVAAGGQAIANHDSVTDPDGCARMVAAAVNTWGKLDVVVNNAGILRDRTFAKMTPAEWDAVIDVHLTGTRNVVRAALDALKKQGGSIINTSSYSGLIGNFGQSNYGAAKAGIYGLSRVLALELRKHGVTVNCIAPVAKTRMTQDLEFVSDQLLPQQISPIVVYLASDRAQDITGQVFGIEGQRIHVYEVKRNQGVTKPGQDLWTQDELHAAISDIQRFDESAVDLIARDDDVITTVFASLPAGFRPSAAAGWRAVVHFIIEGGIDQTLVIADGQAGVQPGRIGQATTTITIDADTMMQLLSGELDPTTAFTSGRAKGTDAGAVLRLLGAFDFTAVARAAGYSR